MELTGFFGLNAATCKGQSGKQAHWIHVRVHPDSYLWAKAIGAKGGG